MNKILKNGIFACLFLCGNTVADDTGKLIKTVKLSPQNLHYQLLEKNVSGRAGFVEKYYRISTDGGETFGRLKKHKPVIDLKHHRFDPLIDSAYSGNGKNVFAKGESMYLVQFDTKVMAAYKEVLQNLGGTIVGYIPRQTVIVKADAMSAQKISHLDFVRWTGPFKSQYKAPPALLKKIEQSKSTNQETVEKSRYLASILSSTVDDIAALTAFLKSIDAQLLLQIRAGSKFIHLNLDDNQLAQLLEFNNLQYIEPWSEPEGDLDIVRQVGGADFIEGEVPWYTGAGVTGEVLDGGLLTTHSEFSDVKLHGDNSTSASHGTPVYGIVFSGGDYYPDARGLLPDGKGIFASYRALTDRAKHTAELVDPLGEYRAVFQTNSWGNGRTLLYSNYSAEMDQIIFENDIIILQSQSNAGSRMSRPQAWAKNIVSVGGVRHKNTAELSDDSWYYGASIGPAIDGRIKPDFSHFYDSVLTTAHYSDNHYRTFGGTSAATPITAGHFGLFFQMWADGILNGTGTPGSNSENNVFDARPHASTAKAFMINTAQQYDFAGIGHDLTRVHQGWGLANVKNLYDIARANQWRFPLVVNESDLLSDQSTNTYTVYVTGTENTWLKATMVYMDPAGDPAAAISTVNDLTLQLISPSGVEYWGNVGLLTGNWSVSGGVPNEVDTVENVFIQNAEVGRWTVNVIADDIVIDSHTETAAVDADYALVLSCGDTNKCFADSHTPVKK